MIEGNTPTFTVRLPPELLTIVREAFPELADQPDSVVIRVGFSVIAKLAQDASDDASGVIGAALVAGYQAAPTFTEAETDKFRQLLPVMLRIYGKPRYGPKSGRTVEAGV